MYIARFTVRYTGPTTGMTEPAPARRYRFGVFEADTATGELRRQGLRIKLNAQPFHVLAMLLERPGELISREEIRSRLWPDGTFVDYEHGLNAAINRIREALGDAASSPRFVETLARRGYRFVAPVERITADGGDPAPAPLASPPAEVEDSSFASAPQPAVQAEAAPAPRRLHFLATAEDLPKVAYPVVQTLFVLLQLMYLAFYVGALANLAEIHDLVSPLPRASQVFALIIVTAAILIPVRAFVLAAALFRALHARRNFLRLWPFLLVADVIWSLSPFLLLHHINFGLALACTTLLVYSPFAQRSLVVMGAGQETRAESAAAR